jgi:hypothetical protein
MDTFVRDVFIALFVIMAVRAMYGWYFPEEEGDEQEGDAEAEATGGVDQEKRGTREDGGGGGGGGVGDGK